MLKNEVEETDGNGKDTKAPDGRALCAACQKCATNPKAVSSSAIDPCDQWRCSYGDAHDVHGARRVQDCVCSCSAYVQVGPPRRGPRRAWGKGVSCFAHFHSAFTLPEPPSARVDTELGSVKGAQLDQDWDTAERTQTATQTRAQRVGLRTQAPRDIQRRAYGPSREAV